MHTVQQQQARKEQQLATDVHTDAGGPVHNTPPRRSNDDRVQSSLKPNRCCAHGPGLSQHHFVQLWYAVFGLCCALVMFWISGNCARASYRRRRCDKRGPRAQRWFRLSDECARLLYERRSGMSWTDPPASVWTFVANCCSLRAGCCRTVCMGWCETTCKVQLV